MVVIKRPRSHSRVTQSANQRARARVRVEQLRQHAAEGHTFEEAIAALGMNHSAARSLLYKVTGTTKYPPTSKSE
jgi:hypothetical protein